VEDSNHLVVAELLGLVGAAVPDLHRAGAVLALGDLALELQVLERVVLCANRQPVLVRMLWHTSGERPRRQRPLVLQAQVPVQPTRVVLLDHEASLGRLPAAAPFRLRGLLEVALLLVGAKPVGHAP
jgi:hypothetical protein